MNPASERIAKERAEHEARQTEADRNDLQPESLRRKKHSDVDPTTGRTGTQDAALPGKG